MAAATPMTIAEIRAELGDYQKKIVVNVQPEYLVGSIDDFVTKIQDMVEESEIEGEFSLGFKPGTNGYYAYQRSPAEFLIVGQRPYTDEEIEGEGSKILAAKKKDVAAAAKKRAADVAKFNKIAARLGVDPLAK